MNDTYLSTREIMKLFGWSSRAAVSKVALRLQWTRRWSGCNLEYLQQDVDNYRIARSHGLQSGLSGINYVEHTSGYSDRCPVCKNLQEDSKNATARNRV